MTLDPATLKRLEDAIPAMGEVHAFLSKGDPRLDDEVSKLAADALWHWPSLLAAAMELHAIKNPKGRYHSLEVK